MTQKEILDTLADDTHSLWNQSFVDKVNEAFETKVKCRTYSSGGGPKGLTTNDGSSEAFGLSSFDLAPALCHQLNVEYATYMGRGFQVRACVAALYKAGYGKD